MPYDPEWDIEGVDYEIPDYGESTEGTDAEQQRGEYDDQPVGLERAGDGDGDGEGEGEMKVNLPQSELSQYSKEDQDATPRNLQSFTAAAAPGKPSRLAVILHSSPRKDGFATPRDDLPRDDDDPARLVTSDLLPQPTNEESGPNPLAARASVAFPVPVDISTPLPTVTPQPKKRGRPFGWKAGSGPYSAMTSSLVPGSSIPRPKPKKPSTEQKVRKRPGRKPAPTARQLYLELTPHFLAFRCEWEDCPAELQNLETLRKHLLIVHGRPSSSPPPPPLVCKWAACAQPLPTKEAFATHIEAAHLAPFLWHVGDGPRNTASAPSRAPSQPALPQYLFDHHGNQVTPSVQGQQVENDDDRKKRQARINRLLLQRDRNAPDEPQYDPAAVEEMAAFMEQKRARQRMLGKYAERVCGGGWEEGWR
ncbi:hypothetical protein BT67DRAFT_405490, partial [Trichocladium antarcticum]